MIKIGSVVEIISDTPTVDGVLYEGTLVDFLIDWEGSFEHKFGNDKLGRKKIKELIKVLNEENKDIEQAIR